MPSTEDDREDSGFSKGTVVAAKWRLRRLLGRGGMGEVWLATHLTLDQEVAFKILDRRSLSAHLVEEARARFDFEARVAARLARKTRHIVTVVDNGRDAEIDYLVMERLEGQSLHDRIEERGALEISEVADIVRQIARGLEVAHAENVIHRDLKPSNVFLAKDEDGNRLVKLLDFGIAKGLARRSSGPRSNHETRDGVVVGTAQYMSPERARGLKTDARADVWSLAVLTYEMLTGRAPYDADTDMALLLAICTGAPLPPSTWRAGLGDAIDRVFARALARSIDDRHQDAPSFANALAEALGVAPPSVKAASEDVGSAPTLRVEAVSVTEVRTDRPPSTVSPQAIELDDAVPTKRLWPLALPLVALILGALLFVGRAQPPSTIADGIRPLIPPQPTASVSTSASSSAIALPSASAAARSVSPKLHLQKLPRNKSEVL